MRSKVLRKRMLAKQLMQSSEIAVNPSKNGLYHNADGFRSKEQLLKYYRNIDRSYLSGYANSWFDELSGVDSSYFDNVLTDVLYFDEMFAISGNPDYIMLAYGDNLTYNVCYSLVCKILANYYIKMYKSGRPVFVKDPSLVEIKNFSSYAWHYYLSLFKDVRPPFTNKDSGSSDPDQLKLFQ